MPAASVIFTEEAAAADPSNVDNGRRLTSRLATAPPVPWVQVARFLSCSRGLAKALTPNNQSKGVKKMTKNGIPDRWLDYQSVGKRIPGTRFIAFKVPLKQSLNCRVQMSDAFGPWDLLDALQKEKQELGLIIDLTFTTRYYKMQDMPESLLCVKIYTAGHEIPSDETILIFKRSVRRFLHDNADNDKLVGVHCTHGLNRTGYLVCRYLIDVDGMDPVAAVELFNSSRGHAIERENYLSDLQSGPKRSNEGIEKCGAEPARGLAVQRPRYTPSSDLAEERPPHAYSHYNHRPPDYRGMNHQSYPCPPPQGNGLLPPPHWPPHPNFPPHLLPNPHFFPPMASNRMGPSPSPYQWRAPKPDSQWRSAPDPYSQSRQPPNPDSQWRRVPPNPDSQWRRPPNPDSESRRPPHLEESKHRAPHREEKRRGHSPPHREEQARRRGHSPPPLPRYTPGAPSADKPDDRNGGESRKPLRKHRPKHRD